MFEEMFFLISTLFFVGIICAGGSCAIWNATRKTGELNDIERATDRFNSALKTAIYRSLLYLLAIIPLILMVIGASTLVEINSNWYPWLVILVLWISLATFVFGICIPLIYLIYSICVLGAIAIDQYVKNNYPLKHYEAKIKSGVRITEQIHYDWMLKESNSLIIAESNLQ